MPISIDQYTRSALSRRIVYEKSDGIANSDKEFNEVLGSISTLLVTTPRIALLLGYRANGSLLSLLAQELSLIDDLLLDITESSNTTSKITNLNELNKAKNALITSETNGAISTTSVNYKKFDKAITNFLNKDLRPMVIDTNSKVIKRTGIEARQSLSSNLTLLKDTHTDILNRISYLSSSVDSLIDSSFNNLAALSVTSKVRADIEAIIDILTENPVPEDSVDILTKLLTGRSIIEVLGSKPNPYSKLIDSSNPKGYVISGRTAIKSASKVGATGDLVLPTSGTLSITDNTGTIAGNFPVPSVHLDNKAHIILTPSSFSYPSNSNLFICIRADSSVTDFIIDATGFYYTSVSMSAFSLGTGWQKQGDRYLKTISVDLNTVSSIATLKSALLALIGTGSSVIDFETGTSVIAIFNSLIDQAQITNHMMVIQESTILLPPDPPQNTYTPYFKTSDAYTYFGVALGVLSNKGITPQDTILRALNYFYGSKIVAETSVNNTEIKLAISGTYLDYGAFLTISGTSASTLGLSGTYNASDNTLTLFGTINGDSTDPISPLGLLGYKDLLSFNGVEVETIDIGDSSLTISTETPTFSGSIEVSSELVRVWLLVSAAISSSVAEINKTRFKENLSIIDLALASVLSASDSASKQKAISLLVQLKALILSVQTNLSANTLDPLSATQEKVGADSILTLLEERKFDRAADFMRVGRFKEFFEMTFETASYSGMALSMASSVAHSEVKFIDTANEDSIPGVSFGAGSKNG